jgi:hypothetical protein
MGKETIDTVDSKGSSPRRLAVQVDDPEQQKEDQRGRGGDEQRPDASEPVGEEDEHGVLLPSPAGSTLRALAARSGRRLTCVSRAGGG